MSDKKQIASMIRREVQDVLSMFELEDGSYVSDHLNGDCFNKLLDELEEFVEINLPDSKESDSDKWVKLLNELNALSQAAAFHHSNGSLVQARQQKPRILEVLRQMQDLENKE